MKWKLEIEMKLLGKNGIIIAIEFIFRMETTLALTTTTTITMSNSYMRSIHST